MKFEDLEFYKAREAYLSDLITQKNRQLHKYSNRLADLLEICKSVSHV